MSDASGTQLTFSVPGMTCGHCEAAVKAEVGKVAGVAAVDVDLGTKVVTVTSEPAHAPDRALLIAAIDEAGFEVA
jgi:copper chaperone